jgi:ubiquinone/menaquinone biosynthesis C-methylase UbiE
VTGLLWQPGGESNRSDAMSTTRSQEALVGEQFGSRASAYLTSVVHATGADLAQLAAIAQARPAAHALDLGCGGGHATFAVAPHVREVVAYDLVPEMLEVVARAARERGLANVTTREGVAERLPFPDASFDLVMSRYSAHHWGDFSAGLAEAARVLAPGGVAAFVDSVSPGTPARDTYLQAIELLRDPSHVRSYTRAEWEQGLARAGLAVTETRRHRVRLVFATWVERMATPQVQVDAIRAVQVATADSVTRYFETEPDGSFTIDVAAFECVKLA